MSVGWWAVSSFGKKKGHTKVCWDIWKANCCYQGRVGKRSKAWGLLTLSLCGFGVWHKRDLGRWETHEQKQKPELFMLKAGRVVIFAGPVIIWWSDCELGEKSWVPAENTFLGGFFSSQDLPYLFILITEPEGSLEQKLSSFRRSLKYKYSHRELHVGAFRLITANIRTCS